jgi:hypothetical protein
MSHKKFSNSLALLAPQKAYVLAPLVSMGLPLILKVSNLKDCTDVVIKHVKIKYNSIEKIIVLFFFYKVNVKKNNNERKNKWLISLLTA